MRRLNAFNRLNANLRTRQLGSDERVGRHSRDIIWKQIESYVRLNWKVLLALLVAPIVGSIPGLLLMKGSERSIAIGAIGISGFWLVLIVIILWSGVASTVMGLEGERLTADILRPFRSKGWFLVNGMKIKGKADIDHVLVGPVGILVVETKWSHERWPMGDKSKKFMFDRLAAAVAQVNLNRSDIRWRFGKIINDATVMAVCVLWSAEGFAGDTEWFEHRGVIVVRGQSLTKWLNTLTAETLDPSSIERIKKVIEKQVLSRDEVDLNYSDPPRPTIHKLFLRSFLAPFLGFLLPLYLLAAVSRANQLWLDASVLLIFPILGIMARRISFLRQAALVWIATSLGLCLIMLGFAVSAFIQ